MGNIINWCNANQGFVSAILSIATICISILALFISIKIGKVPYKKKFKAIATYYELDQKPIIDVFIINYGLVTLVIDYVSITDERGTPVGSTTDLMPIIIKPAETQTIRIFISDFNGLIKKNSLDLNKHITIEIREYGAKTYKFEKGFPVG